MSFTPLSPTPRTSSPISLTDASKPSSPAPKSLTPSSAMEIGIPAATSSQWPSGALDPTFSTSGGVGAHFELPALAHRTIMCTNCTHPARLGSKYCSKACGVSAMLEKVKQEKAAEEEARRRARFDRRCGVIWSEIEKDLRESGITSVAELEDVKAMEEVEEERRSTHASIEALKRQQIELEELITRNVQVPAMEHPEENEAAASLLSGRTSHLDCPYCGAAQPSGAATMAHHMSTCFQKFEALVPLFGTHATAPNDVNSLIYCDALDPKTNQYCKKLKASCYQHSGVLPARPPNTASFIRGETRFPPGSKKASAASLPPKPKDKKKEKPTHAALAAVVCGAPTADDPSGICRLNRRDCPRHYNWDNIARRQLELQVISLSQLLEALRQEALGIKERMILRRLCRGLQGNATTIPGPAALPLTTTPPSNAMDVS